MGEKLQLCLIEIEKSTFGCFGYLWGSMGILGVTSMSKNALKMLPQCRKNPRAMFPRCRKGAMRMPTRTINDGYYVDGKTGETIPVPANTSLMGEEEREGFRRRAEQTQEHKEYVVAQNEVCGDFYWTLFDSKEEYYPEVSDSMLAKIVYLITYMDYETNLLVMQDSPTSPKRPMLKKDVSKIIRLHRCKFSRFWDDLLATGIIVEEDDGKLRVCSRFCKGKLAKNNMAAMKVFTHAVRYMYENIDVRSHQYISYLFRLIPYINLRHNVFCKNPLETERSEIVRMTAKDMCHIFGIDDSQVKRFIKTLFKLSFVDKNGDKRSVITLVTNYKNDGERNFVLINPQFYAGYMSKGDMLSVLDEFTIKNNGEQ